MGVLIPYQKELKKDGLFLKRIPTKERTPEQCSLAVRQNPKALKYVPCKLQTVALCKAAMKRDPTVFSMIALRNMSEKLSLYAVKLDGMNLKYVDDRYQTKAVYHAAVNNTIKALKYVPTEAKNNIFLHVDNVLLDRCLQWMHEDETAIDFFPDSVKMCRAFLDYQKEHGNLRVVYSGYDSKSKLFVIKVSYSYTSSSGVIKRQYATITFPDFEKYYSYLEGNINGAQLRNYSFDGVDLRTINYTGAVIHSDVLEKQGLYDNTYYAERFEGKQNEELPIGKNELTLSNAYRYLRPVEDEKKDVNDAEHIPIFYISDIHIWHRIEHKFKKKATKEEIYSFIRFLVSKMVTSVGTLPCNSYLLIAGDTSSLFEYTQVFYKELVKYWSPSRIVVISGNHELWDPPVSTEDNIKIHRDFFKSLRINYLHNDLLCVDDTVLLYGMLSSEKQPRIISEQELITMSEEKIYEKTSRCPLLIWGGIGYSGLNEKYNVFNISYGVGFDNLPKEEARAKEIAESERFSKIYHKLSNALPKNRLIVLTHMRKPDWTTDPYIPMWIYVNGHNHRNYYLVNEQKCIYADNQIGYHTESVGLKHFYIDSNYDIFSNYEDGIYQITPEQYIDFNRGKRIQSSFKRKDVSVIMLKRHGFYMFLYYGKYSRTAKSESLYLLSGGRMLNLPLQYKLAIQYYYDDMERYIDNIHKLMYRYTLGQEALSQFIIRLGGSGKIHGCIIDVDRPEQAGDYSYTHLFVNPIDGRVTPYFAWDTRARTVYKDFQALLEHEEVCKPLLENYRLLLDSQSENLPPIRYGTSVEEWGEDDSVYDKGGYLYKISRIIKSLQYCTEKNVIRTWNENILNQEFVDNIMIAQNAESVMDDKLLVN